MPPARVAAAILIACATAGAAAPPAAARPNWQRPVVGPVTRGFDYAGDPFAAGRHRGADFAVRPRQPVRSACAGRVVFAGTAGSNGPTVSVRCGAWRVAYLPLRTLAVPYGARVERGALLGTAAGTGGHAGLHVGVRREGARWEYVDPLPFFGAPGESPLAPPPRPLRPPASTRPVPAAPRHPLAAPRASPLLSRTDPLLSRTNPLRPRSKAPARGPEGLATVAPWPAWAGLALVLVGACGARLARRRRAPRAVATRVPQSDAG